MATHTFANIRVAKALLNEVTQCGVQPPKELTDLIAAYDQIEGSDLEPDPTTELIKAVAAGQITGDELNQRITDAALGVYVREFRAGLQHRVESAVVHQFVDALEQGAADAIIESLTPAFDKAATALTQCAELVDANTNPEAFLATASAQQIKAWQAIDEHTAVLAKISSVVAHFGPHSTTFPLTEVPANLATNTGFINNNAVMCVDPKYGLVQACTLFASWGNHRNSPWFKGAPVLKLNTIAEAREKIRSWAETSWNALGINSRGRGHINPDGEFVADPVANPYALEEAVTR